MSSIVAACGFLLVVGVYFVIASRLRKLEALIVTASPPAPDDAFDRPRISPSQSWREAVRILVKETARKTRFLWLFAVTIGVLICFLMAAYGLHGLLLSFQVDQGRGIPLGPMLPALASLALGAVLLLLIAALFRKLRLAKR
jgi:uncharacterized protein YjeT (DUF2065 family)